MFISIRIRSENSPYQFLLQSLQRFGFSIYGEPFPLIKYVLLITHTLAEIYVTSVFRQMEVVSCIFASTGANCKLKMDDKLDDIIKCLTGVQESNSENARIIKRLQERMDELEEGSQGKQRKYVTFSKGVASMEAGQHGGNHDYARSMDDDDQEVSFKVKTKEGQEITVFVNKSELPKQEVQEKGGVAPFKGSQQWGWSSQSMEDIQAEFRVLQDVYSRVKLHSDMKFVGSKVGLKAPQKETVMVIGNCAKYAETAMKILMYMGDQAGDPSDEVNPQLQEMFLCMYALIRYLQEDHCSLIVAGNYRPRTQMMFRSIRKNTSAFTPELIEDVKSAAQLAVIPQEGSVLQNQRGRGYSGWSGGPNARFRGGFNQYRGRGRGFQNELPSVSHLRNVPMDRQQNQEM